MSSIAQTSSPSSRPSLVVSFLRDNSLWLAIGLVLVVALLMRHAVVANTDVSWAFTLGEKVLAGERPYVDFIEVNPPATIYLYLPPLLIARATGLSPELMTDTFVFIAIAVSLALASRVLAEARLLDSFNRTVLFASVGVILAILPAQTFGEREHIGLIVYLPMMAVLTVRAKGGTPRAWSLVVAGLGAGIMMVIKPHMALGFAATLPVTVYAARSPRMLFLPENWIAAVVAVGYGAGVAVLFPEYLSDTIPLLRATYAPLRNDLSILLFNFQAVPVWSATLLVLAILRRRRGADCLYAILLAGSAGFAAAFLVQGKGWPYHSYPMLALAFLALAFAMAERRAEPLDRFQRGGWILAATCIPTVTFAWMNGATTLAPLNGLIRAIKPHPTMLTITPDISIGHPLVREVGGTWVGRTGSQWITGAVLWRRSHQMLSAEERARLDRYAALDRALLIDALRRAKPDIVIIQKLPSDWNAWARADREIAELLKPYREALTLDEILVLQRADIADPPTPRS